jgi:hypothetical protein
VRDMKCSNLESHVQGSFCFCFEIPTDGGLLEKCDCIHVLSIVYDSRFRTLCYQEQPSRRDNVYCILSLVLLLRMINEFIQFFILNNY